MCGIKIKLCLGFITQKDNWMVFNPQWTWMFLQTFVLVSGGIHFDGFAGSFYWRGSAVAILLWIHRRNRSNKIKLEFSIGIGGHFTGCFQVCFGTKRNERVLFFVCRYQIIVNRSQLIRSLHTNYFGVFVHFVKSKHTWWKDVFFLRS